MKERVREVAERGRGEVERRVQQAKATSAALRDADVPEAKGRVETVGYVVEQRPVAEIVAPVKEEKKDAAAASAGKRLV
jgi:hypothetical protein